VLVIFGKATLPLAVLGLLLVVPRAGWAEASPDEALARAREQLDHQDYRDVLRTAEPLGQDESAALHVRLAALELTGVSHLLLRSQSRAQEAFEALLALDPGHQLSDDSYPPRISEFFNMVRESLGPPQEIDVRLAGALPEEIGALQGLEVAVRLGEGRARVASVVLLTRSDQSDDYGEQPFDCDAATGGCTASADVPEGAEMLELFVEARAPSGHRLGGVGTATAPSRVAVTLATEGDGGDQDGVEPPPPGVTPWYATWWFWTVIGVGVAAVVGGVTAGVLLSEPPEPEPGTMGTARLP